MGKSEVLTLGFGAAVLAAFMLSDIFHFVGVPNIVVAAPAIINAATLGLGVAVASILDKCGPKT